jgi:histidyl-tRNA synthetase
MKLVPITTQLFFKRAIGVAEHYGFRSIDDVHAPDCLVRSDESAHAVDSEQPDHRFDYQVLPTALRTYASTTELRKKQAGMFYTPSVVSHPAAPSAKISAVTLSTIGVQDALSEVVLIKSATSILAELGVKNYVVRINSIGDSDSSARFVRELTTQLRQKAHDLPEDLRERFRVNPAALLAYLYENRHPFVASLPGPIDFLTAPSRKYFKEVLELLENSDIPFELDDKLYGNHKTYCHTVFEVVEQASSTQGEQILARGGRYDNLTKAYTRSSVPAVGIVIAMQTKDMGDTFVQQRRKKPNACLVHIGREARIRSIGIIEHFRREKIPIEQCFQYERFTEQIAYAEANNIKYVIIIGQREAHDGVVIVRNSIDRSQHNVPIDGLADYLRSVAV